MANSIPWWSLSHWYMWMPLWLLIIVPGAVAIVRMLKDIYKDRQEHKLYTEGVISVNEYRERKRIK